MSVITFPKKLTARTFASSEEASVLKSISQHGVAAARWQRAPSREFSDWVNALPVAQLPKLRSFLPVDRVEEAVQAACDIAKMPSSPKRDLLASDVAALAFIMSKVMDTPQLHVRLDVVSNDACRRFHIDNMTARMLCTYRGTGTQLAAAGEEDRPTTVDASDVVLLRGKLWPSTEETALLHRSPPITGTGETRLLAVIDPATDHRTAPTYH